MRIQTTLSPDRLPEARMGLRVAELFAGVGGFRKGLEAAGGFDTVWFNQWEPASRKQHAYECYVENFEKGRKVELTWNMDIAQVEPADVPDHDLLVGGFPCQDYSVAATLDKSKGLQGKKGVLWWAIRDILEAKRPAYVLLENVDRLLRSPASQRGRDFGILLACLRDLGYMAEWRVLNAADYGFPQKRRRVFIFAARNETDVAGELIGKATDPQYLTKHGFFPSEFPVRQEPLESNEPVAPKRRLPDDLLEVSDDFELHFLNAGLMADGRIWTRKVEATRTDPLPTLRSVLTEGVDEKYYVPEDLLRGPPGKKTWAYFRGPKKELRTARNGHQYYYAEGGMAFPDPVDQPARTILTGEGGTSPSRSKHVIEDPWTHRFRVLTPEEVEKLNGFSGTHTEMMQPERWRYFTMGNALVVGLVERMGSRLRSLIDESYVRAEAAETPCVTA